MKNKQESKLVATAISEGMHTSLITPNARYEIVDGRVVSAGPIKNYKSEVARELNQLRDRTLTGFYSGEYHLRIFGNAPDVKLS